MTSAVEVLRSSLASRHGRRITPEEAEALARIERLVEADRRYDAARSAWLASRSASDDDEALTAEYDAAESDRWLCLSAVLGEEG